MLRIFDVFRTFGITAGTREDILDHTMAEDGPITVTGCSGYKVLVYLSFCSGTFAKLLILILLILWLLAGFMLPVHRFHSFEFSLPSFQQLDFTDMKPTELLCLILGNSSEASMPVLYLCSGMHILGSVFVLVKLQYVIDPK